MQKNTSRDKTLPKKINFKRVHAILDPLINIFFKMIGSQNCDRLSDCKQKSLTYNVVCVRILMLQGRKILNTCHKNQPNVINGTDNRKS